MMRTQREDSEDVDSRKIPIMRTLARLHDCDVRTLYSSVEGSELDIHEILVDMVSKKEVEATLMKKSGRRDERFSLTLKGWGEYLRALGSLYELPE